MCASFLQSLYRVGLNPASNSVAQFSGIRGGSSQVQLSRFSYRFLCCVLIARLQALCTVYKPTYAWFLIKEGELWSAQSRRRELPIEQAAQRGLQPERPLASRQLTYC
jgi:hypothetical protein